MTDSLETTRKDYQRSHLVFNQLPSDPSDLLIQWLEDAQGCDPEDYNAMVLSTRSMEGGSNSRIVLLRAF